MAHTEVREKVDGTKAYKAEVVVTIDGKRCKRCATFSSRTTASRWAAKKEKELRAPGGLEEERRAGKPLTVADAVKRYVDAHEFNLKPTKKQVLSFVKDERCSFSKLELDLHRFCSGVLLMLCGGFFERHG